MQLNVHELTTTETTVAACMAVVCVLFGGLMSGLTVGLASIDRLSLEIDAKTNERARKSSKRIFPVIDRHNWMLVTLLLCNAAAAEALPIFLERLFPAWVAILISVTAILIFGEILPQAVCTGPSQIKIAVFCCPVVQFFMWITSPVSWPISKALDNFLGGRQI
jgi:metal transporter CNNM